jgi:DNA-binding NarL/FixJ family response regulator
MSRSEGVPVFLVDDHPLVRSALEQLLVGAGLSLAGQAGGIRETLNHPGLARSRLVVVDLALGEESGLDLIKLLRARGLAVLVYSMHEGSTVIRRALDAGADGYVTKREAAQALLDAIKAVMAGSRFLSPRVEAALRELTTTEGLSGQQQQIYRLLGQGLSNEEIARQLAISVRTLESYCVRILDKLGLQGIRTLRRQAIRDAGTNGPGEGASL